MRLRCLCDVTRFHWALIIALCFSVGCRKHVRVYPVCLYDTAPGASAQAAAEWPILRSHLAKAATLATRNPADVVVVTSRAAVIRTNRRSDAELRAIWPPIACYGSSSGTASGQMLEICVEYVRVYVQTRPAGAKLPSSTVVPPCQTLPGDSAKILVEK
jgi:hypothetical protein